jgi:hypothetical protein
MNIFSSSSTDASRFLSLMRPMARQVPRFAVILLGRGSRRASGRVGKPKTAPSTPHQTQSNPIKL